MIGFTFNNKIKIRFIIQQLPSFATYIYVIFSPPLSLSIFSFCRSSACIFSLLFKSHFRYPFNRHSICRSRSSRFVVCSTFSYFSFLSLSLCFSLFEVDPFLFRFCLNHKLVLQIEIYHLVLALDLLLILMCSVQCVASLCLVKMKDNDNVVKRSNCTIPIAAAAITLEATYALVYLHMINQFIWSQLDQMPKVHVHILA